jgi:hypothetical protein
MVRFYRRAPSTPPVQPLFKNGRPRLSQIHTVWREAEKLLGDDTAALQMVDPLT